MGDCEVLDTLEEINMTQWGGVEVDMYCIEIFEKPCSSE